MKYRDPIAWERTLPTRPSSPAWVASVRAIYGTLEPEDLALFAELSGGREAPDGGALEAQIVAGRRAGKSEAIARLAVFECIHGGHGRALAPGQAGLFAVVSPLRDQSQQVLGFARGLATLPSVRRYLAGEPTRDTIAFRTGVQLRVMTADAVAVSGPTLIGCVLDEWAKAPGDDAVEPDRVIEASLRPALAPVVGAPRRRFVTITSSYIKEGTAFERDRDYFGVQDAPVLVLRGSTELYNPAIDREWLRGEYRRNRRVFSREYLNEWQDSVDDGYFAEVLERCIDIGRNSSPPKKGTKYVVALDPAFKHDSFAIAVAHRERDEHGPVRTVVDLVHAWVPPARGELSADETLRAVAAICETYNVKTAYTDQASASALKEPAARAGIWLVEKPWATGLGENSKTLKFATVKTAMADGLVRLPDDRKTISEFANVAATKLRSGAEQIEARRGRDDRVSACVLAVHEAMALEPDRGHRIPRGSVIIGPTWEQTNVDPGAVVSRIQVGGGDNGEWDGGFYSPSIGGKQQVQDWLASLPGVRREPS